MTITYQKFVDAALAMQGKPYIWGGKGTLQFVNGKLIKHKFTSLDDVLTPLEVFDCSGLVTVALRLATLGAVKLCGSHSAKTILDTFPIAKGDEGDGVLILYKSHVAIDIGRGRVVDANRGDQSTTSLQAAQDQGAKVEVHRTVRPLSSILGYRRIPLSMDELIEVPKVAIP